MTSTLLLGYKSQLKKVGVEANLSPLLKNPIVPTPIAMVLNKLPYSFSKCLNNFALTDVSVIPKEVISPACIVNYSVQFIEQHFYPFNILNLCLSETAGKKRH